METKPQKYAALITRKDGNSYWAVDVDPNEAGPSIVTSRPYPNLSIPRKAPIILGIYSVNPCDFTNLLLQSERGIIAWRVWEDTRGLSDIARDFHRDYEGCEIETHRGGKGDYSLITFRESALIKLLEASLFRAEQVEE